MSTPSKNNNDSNRDHKPPPPKPGEPAPTHDEAAFLAQQAADAKAAIARTLSEIGTNFGQAANVSAWTREHPWLTLGASTIAGFVATAVVVPSKEDQALKRLAKIERALNPPPPEPSKKDADDDKDPAKRFQSGRQGFMRSVMGEVLKAVQPALLSMLTAGVTAQATKPSEEEMKAAAAKEDQDQKAGVAPGASDG